MSIAKSTHEEMSKKLDSITVDIQEKTRLVSTSSSTPEEQQVISTEIEQLEAESVRLKSSIMDAEAAVTSVWNIISVLILHLRFLQSCSHSNVVDIMFYRLKMHWQLLVAIARKD